MNRKMVRIDRHWFCILRLEFFNFEGLPVIDEVDIFDPECFFLHLIKTKYRNNYSLNNMNIRSGRREVEKYIDC